MKALEKIYHRIFIEKKTQLRYGNRSLDFIKGFEIYIKSVRIVVEAILNARTNVKFINLQDGETLSDPIP